MVARKVLLFAFVLLGVMVAVLPASAGTTAITLGSSQPVEFVGTGSSDSVAIDLGKCSGSTCSMSGVASGSGLFSSKGAFDISSPSNIELDLTNPTTGQWTAVTEGNTIQFSYGPGGSLLTGDLNLLQFSQVSSKVSGKQDWYLTSADLTVTGGSLDLTPGMSLELYFNNVPAYFNSLLGPSNAGSTESTSFGHGTLTATPEPASILLLGAGFLLIGGVLRSRYRRPLTTA